jgi:DNA-binding transcriptional MerR regulator
MATYTVKQLARLSGVSVRTLHHYDEIGLLKPAFTGENRYRYYGREELLRLQDILFHRELGVPLQEIGRLLDLQGRDRAAVLGEHRKWLDQRIKRSRQLLRTIDRTIAELNGESAMDDNELYKGFSPEKQAEYEDWLVERYGGAMRAAIDEGKARFAALSEEERLEALAEGNQAEIALAECFKSGAEPNAPEVAPLICRHHAWVTRMWGRERTPLSYAGLANLYVSHPNFVERFEKHGAGFTEWLSNAMKLYAAALTSG